LIETAMAAGTPEAASPPSIQLPIDAIAPSPVNPRQDFDDEYITQLARSLSRDGQWDPLLVRKRPDGSFELISGECRLRAAKKLGWKTIRCTVVNVDDREAYVLALKTNVTRRNLNVVEESEALLRISRLFGLTQVELAELLEKDQSWVSRRLALATRLADYCKDALRRGKISPSHADLLVHLPEDQQVKMCKEVVRKGMGVRSLRSLIENRSAYVADHPRRSVLADHPLDADLELARRFIRRSLQGMGYVVGTRPVIEEHLCDGELLVVIRVPSRKDGPRLVRRDYLLSSFDSFESAQSFAEKRGGFCAGVYTLRGEKFWMLYLGSESGTPKASS